MALTNQMTSSSSVVRANSGAYRAWSEANTERLRGTAAHADGRTVRFETAMEQGKPLEGIRFERVLGQETGRVRITVDLNKWLGRIDFATASPADARGISTFPTGSQAMNALVRGVEDTSAYVVTWVEGATP